MAFLAPLVTAAVANPFTAAAVGTGLYFGGKGLIETAGKAFGGTSSGNQPPTPEPLPEAPTPEVAKVDAAEEMKKKRRASALSGGLTDLTRGQALVPETNVGRKSLLGA